MIEKIDLDKHAFTGSSQMLDTFKEVIGLAEKLNEVIDAVNKIEKAFSGLGPFRAAKRKK